jgi:hypothetical protein
MRLNRIVAAATMFAALTLLMVVWAGEPLSLSSGSLGPVSVSALGQKACDPKTQKCGGCSPGFYKNHPDIWVNICCSATSDPSCADLTTALNCKGSDASCGRSAAAAFLDACTGCTE